MKAAIKKNSNMTPIIFGKPLNYIGFSLGIQQLARNLSILIPFSDR